MVQAMWRPAAVGEHVALTAKSTAYSVKQSDADALRDKTNGIPVQKTNETVCFNSSKLISTCDFSTSQVPFCKFDDSSSRVLLPWSEELLWVIYAVSWLQKHICSLDLSLTLDLGSVSLCF